MKWLMIHPEDAPSTPVYLAWLEGFGIAADVVAPDGAMDIDATSYGGLLLSGGGDIDPQRYGEPARHAKTYDVDPARDRLEVALIDAFILAGRPIFGICRGQQVLNVAFGGGLIQHVPDALGEAAPEIHSKKGTYDSLHGLVVERGGGVAAALRDVAVVNSAHHQAIDPARLGNGLRVAARSPAGIIEAVECADFKAPIAAVQWHPERLPKEHPAAPLLRMLPGFLD
jgi:putative glutamine amidotransferase